MIRSFHKSNAPVDFLEVLFTEFAVFSMPASRDNLSKASYSRTHQRDQGAG